MKITRADAAAARSQQVRQLADRPSQRRCAQEGEATRHARGAGALVERAEAEADGPVRLRGYASVAEKPYEMWDAFGPYTEVVSADAFDVTLARNPDVVLNYQHGRIGTPIARTTIADGQGSLQLSADETGLLVLAEPATGLWTTTEMLRLLEVGLMTEMSFAFSITRGSWSPDYEEYRIHEVDIDRGDVSLVNYGANPATSIDVVRAADLVEYAPSGSTRTARARMDAALALLRPSRA
jgi:HK97 family phage prohead protease